MITHSLLRSSTLFVSLTLVASTAFSDVQERGAIPTYVSWPLHFEANQGQARDEVKFLARGPGYGVYLTANEAVLALSQPPSRNGEPSDIRSDSQCSAPHSVRMSLMGGAQTSAPHALEEQPGKANYLIGQDSSQWHTNIPTYAKVRYDAVYPGVDVVYYGNQRQLEYDFVLAPGADPKQIELAFDGADRVEIDANGDLVLHACGREVRQAKPVVYQDAGGRHEVAGRYIHKGKNRIGFAVAAYDRSLPLVIDPLVLSYATYLGGVDVDAASAVAVDPRGAAYVVGTTGPQTFVPGNCNCYAGAPADVFITKFNPDGSVSYSTHLGGAGDDRATSVAVDSAGNAYVLGITQRLFPTTRGAYQETSSLPDDQYHQRTFVAKLDPTGSALVYSTLLSGTGNFYSDRGKDVAVDAAGNAYVAGLANSPDFPTTSGTGLGFVAKFNPTGSALVYSDRFAAEGNSIALDSGGNAYVTGIAGSGLQVTNGAFQTTARGEDAFVMKLDTLGGLVYATLLGGTDYVTSNPSPPHEGGLGITVDAEGSAYVTGVAYSPDFPTTPGAYSSGPGGGFVTKLNPSGTGLVYSTYLKSSGVDIAVDPSGRAYLAAAEDDFVTVVEPSGSVVRISGISGGTPVLVKAAAGIALDAEGRNAWVVGITDARNFPVTPDAYQPALAGLRDAFVAKFSNYGRGIPGTFEAEDFDQGGEGPGYHENTPGNQGDAGYRTGEDVDIFVSNDSAGGGRIIKNFESGEWLAYTISVPTSSNYDVDIRAATNFDFPNSSYYVQVDGINVSGIITLPDTGGWDQFAWIGKSTIALTAGTHLMKIVAVNPYFALNSIRVTSNVAPSPYYGTPTAVPGEFEAEAFDAGGEGVAYHDNSPGNQGDTGLRAGEDVDIFVSNDAQSGSPYIVKNMEAGEWLDYTISVSSNGSYDVELRAATNFDFPNPAYHVEVDGVNVSGTITLPDTGGWDNYQWIGRTSVTLTAGTHVLKVVSERPYFGLNSIRVTTTGASGPTPNAVPGVIEAENFDAGGEGPGYHENTPGNQGNAGFRTAEDVDIFGSNDSGSGSWYIVKNFEAGEWLAYTISVPTSGNYDVDIRAATNFDFPNASYYVQVDGTNVSGIVVLPDTGGWDNYQWIGKRTISLSAGTHLLRIVAEQPYFGFNALRLSPSTP